MIKIVSSSPEEDALLEKVEQYLQKENNIYVDKVTYCNSFGGTLWSVDDLIDTEAKDWPEYKKLKFMEFAAKQIKNDAIDRGWDSIKTLISEFDDNE